MERRDAGENRKRPAGEEQFVCPLDECTWFVQETEPGSVAREPRDQDAGGRQTNRDRYDATAMGVHRQHSKSQRQSCQMSCRG